MKGEEQEKKSAKGLINDEAQKTNLLLEYQTLCK
jgi:hypothetical protein